MGDLRQAILDEAKWGTTENGALTLVSTTNKCLDFFGRAGSMRQASLDEKLSLFDAAFKEDKEIALKLLFYTRDIRGGYGERNTFNQMFTHLAEINKQSVVNNIWAVLEFGRAKDLYSLIGTPCEKDMWEFMKMQFELDLENMEKGNAVSLLAKWIATPDSKSIKTSELGKKTAKHLGYSYVSMREYKTKLRALRRYLDLPEAKMATGRWDEIEYSKCASKFLLKNRVALKRHDEERYTQFIEKVDAGEEKMNMGVVSPCDIIQQITQGKYTPDLETMWRALPDVNNGNALVICDTSGSMWWENSKASGVYPGDVAFALSIYFAERNKGNLKDMFMTFNTNPKFVELTGHTLKDKYAQIYGAEFGGSTNLEGAFDLLLRIAYNSNLSNEDMPDALIIVSDMQINVVRGLDNNNRMTFHTEMKRRYEEKGYTIPHVIFWNVNAKKASFLASTSENGVSFTSGWSTNIFKQVMENIGTTPYDLMMAIVNSERYKEIKVEVDKQLTE